MNSPSLSGSNKGLRPSDLERCFQHAVAANVPNPAKTKTTNMEIAATWPGFSWALALSKFLLEIGHEEGDGVGGMDESTSEKRKAKSCCGEVRNEEFEVTTNAFFPCGKRRNVNHCRAIGKSDSICIFNFLHLCLGDVSQQ